MLLALPVPVAFVQRFFTFAARPRVTRWFAGQVRQGATREIPLREGRITVHCREGEAWITHDGDRRDVILQARESYTVDHGARMTLHALRGDCVYEVEVNS